MEKKTFKQFYTEEAMTAGSANLGSGSEIGDDDSRKPSKLFKKADKRKKKEEEVTEALKGKLSTKKNRRTANNPIKSNILYP